MSDPRDCRTSDRRKRGAPGRRRRLTHELAEIKSGKAAPPPEPRDEGARVVPILNERTDGLPTLKEMERLFIAVKQLAPWPLNDKYDDHRPFRGFTSAFRWISNKGRVEQPNPRFALSFWLDQCKNWLRDRNSMTNDVSANELVMAALAAGDVKYVAANAQLGFTWELALSEHGGRPASPDGWRRILAGGAAAILPPSSPARRMPPLSNVRIVAGY